MIVCHQFLQGPLFGKLKQQPHLHVSPAFDPIVKIILTYT